MKPPDGASAAASAALAWSGNGRLLAYCSQPGRIVIADRVDDETARERVVLATSQPIDTLALSHSGEWLAVGGGESVALWWHDLSRRQAIEVTRGTLPRPAGTKYLIKLAFSPDGKSLAVGCGIEVLLLRIDPEALRPRQPTPVLHIRTANQGRLWEFVLETPEGQLTNRIDAPADLNAFSPERVMLQLRRMLTVIDPESAGSATPAEQLEKALTPIRHRLLPSDFGESQAMEAANNAVALDIGSDLAGYPWELLLTGRGTTPLAVTHALLRATPVPTAATRPSQPADAPMHALFLSASSALKVPESVLDLDDRQGERLAAALREGGAPQGLIEYRWRATAAEAMSALLGTAWRLLVLIGMPNDEGDLALDGDVALGQREIGAMSRLPDVMLMIGGDFRRLASRMREAGVAVCVAAGWPMDTDSLQCFFSEWLRLLRSGEPLIRTVQMARQYTKTHSDGTAWALEVHGEPLWTWPEVPMWQELRADAADSAVGSDSTTATLTPAMTGSGANRMT